MALDIGSAAINTIDFLNEAEEMLLRELQEWTGNQVDADDLFGTLEKLHPTVQNIHPSATIFIGIFLLSTFLSISLFFGINGMLSSVYYFFWCQYPYRWASRCNNAFIQADEVTAKTNFEDLSG